MRLFSDEIRYETDKRINCAALDLNNFDENDFLIKGVDIITNDMFEKYKFIDLPIIDYGNPYLNENPIIDRNSISFNILIPINGDISSLRYKPSSEYLMCNNYGAFIDENNNVLAMQVNLKNNPNFEIDNYIEKTVQDREKNINIQYKYLQKDIIKHNTILKTSILRTAEKMFNELKIKKELTNKTQQSKYLRIIPKSSNPIRIVEKQIITESNKILPQKEKTKEILQLEKDSYIQIFNTLNELSVYVNRLPKSYFKLGEEDIRDIIVNSLNLKLKTATATGETFNVRGKTDIIIIDNKVIYFIAECKIWKGQCKFKEAINQLLSYISEEVCYSSLVIFNKTKKNINELAINEIKNHTSFIKEIENNRFIMKHPKNNIFNLEISLIIFNIYCLE